MSEHNQILQTNIKPEFFKDPLRWMVYHSVSANLLMVILLVVGTFLMFGIKQELMPEFESDTISVSAYYNAASVDNMESSIAIPTENAISKVDGIGDVSTSISATGVIIKVEILDSKNIGAIQREIQSAVNKVSDYPEDMTKPAVAIAKFNRPLIYLNLTGDVDAYSLNAATDLVLSEFAKYPSAGTVTPMIVNGYQINIYVSDVNLRKYNLSLEQIGNKVKAAGFDLGAGSIKNSRENINIRFNYKKYKAKDFESVVIKTMPDGSSLRLRNIAKIKDEFSNNDFSVTSGNKDAQFFTVYAREGQTPQSVSSGVTKAVAQVQSSLPRGLKLKVVYDSKDDFTSKAETLIRDGLIGVILITIILSLFLEWKLAFWTAWGIPISFLGSFILLYLTKDMTGFSINMISLFAFIIVLGIVIDDAIVVSENVYFYKEKFKKYNSKDATAAGVKEVSSSVFFSIFTNIVAFMPLLFISGKFGSFFRQIPLVVVFVLLVSLFESLFILPARIASPNPIPKKPNKYNVFIRFKSWFNRGLSVLIGYYYINLLNKICKYRYFVLTIIIALMIVFVGYLKSGKVGFVFMIPAESEVVNLSVDFPASSTIQSINQTRTKLINKAQAVGAKLGGKAEYKDIISFASNSNLRILVFLAKSRKYSAFQFSDEWKNSIKDIDWFGTNRHTFTSSRGVPGGNASITMNISDSSIYKLKKAVKELVNKLKQYKYVTNVTTDQSGGPKEYNFALNRYGDALGVTPAILYRQVRNSVFGFKAIEQVIGRNTSNIVVRLPKNEVNSISAVKQNAIKTPSGSYVPLGDIADVQSSVSSSSISRLNYQRNIQINAYVNPDTKSGSVLEKFLSTDFNQAKQKYLGLSYNKGGRQKEQSSSMRGLMIGFIISLITIYTALAMFFNSYIQPLIIMLVIPFGFVGAILGNIIMDFPLSMASMFGLLALSGVVVNASMIIIYFSNTKRSEYGVSAQQAIISTSKRRFRPIILTSITAFLGSLPIIMSSDSQVAFLKPIAVALGFGVLFSAIITLIFMPVFYLIVEDLRNLLKINNKVKS